MNAPTADVFAVLEVANDNGSVDRAISRAGKKAIAEAVAADLIEIIHNPAGVVSAHWATEQADYTHQRDRMHVQLTPTGADRLRSAR